MWYIFYKLSSQFLPFLFSLFGASTKGNSPNPVLKIASLGPNHEYLITKAFIFVLFMIIAFTGGFAYNHFFANTEKNEDDDMEISKKYFSKLTILIIIMLLNFFINKLHLFVYNADELIILRRMPSNSMFYIFFILLLIFLFGFLTINSKLVPEQFHLNTQFFDSEAGFIKNLISYSLISICALYALSNVLLDPSWIYYILISILMITSFALNRKQVNIWVVYGLMSLLMIDNYQYIVNVKVSRLWSGIHYIIYAIQLAMIIFGLIKLDNYNFFYQE